MIGITRYHISDGNHPSVEYVTYEDHLARIAQLEAALQLIGNELSLHADQGPAGDAFRALLVPTLETPSDPFAVQMLMACPKCYGHHPVGAGCPVYQTPVETTGEP